MHISNIYVGMVISTEGFALDNGIRKYEKW